MDLLDLDTKLIARIVKELINDYLDEPCYGTENQLVEVMKIFFHNLEVELDKRTRQKEVS